MSQQVGIEEQAVLHVENIGGITETTVELQPGITLLAGRNATNRTSLLRGLMAVLGSDRVSLKGDADEGYIELTLGGETYSRSIRQENDEIVLSGDPYLSDSHLADLFGFLLESNRARQAVVRDENLRDIIMEPIDTKEIEKKINQLQNERKEIDSKIENIDQLERSLPSLEEEKQSIELELTEKRELVSEKKAELDSIDENLQERKENKRKLDDKLGEFNETREEIESINQEIASERQSIESLREERAKVENELNDLVDLPTDRIDEINGEVRRLRSKVDEIETAIDTLQTAIQANEDLLDGNLGIFADLNESEDDGTVTDALLNDSEELVCWTCGSKVKGGQVEEMTDQLRSIREAKMADRNAVEQEIDDLLTEQKELEKQQRHRKQLRRQSETIADEINNRESRIEEHQTRQEELYDKREQLESAVEELRTADYSEFIDLHKEVNQIEVEIDQLRARREETSDEITQIETRIDERAQLEVQREELRQEIKQLRTRIDDLEREAADQFNEHMDTILGILEYGNIDRIWLERTERTVREDRRKVTKSYFDLHIVRRTDDGVVYEDTIDHLSESEREVTGLVFGLAGYLAHNLFEELPFMILDSIEAIDAQRIADLITYFADYPDYLVVALLEEDATALDDSYRRVTGI